MNFHSFPLLLPKLYFASGTQIIKFLSITWWKWLNKVENICEAFSNNWLGCSRRESCLSQLRSHPELHHIPYSCQVKMPLLALRVSISVWHHSASDKSQDSIAVHEVSCVSHSERCQSAREEYVVLQQLSSAILIVQVKRTHEISIIFQDFYLRLRKSVAPVMCLLPRMTSSWCTTCWRPMEFKPSHNFPR